VTTAFCVKNDAFLSDAWAHGAVLAKIGPPNG
jgi:hypothetical protein